MLRRKEKRINLNVLDVRNRYLSQEIFTRKLGLLWQIGSEISVKYQHTASSLLLIILARASGLGWHLCKGSAAKPFARMFYFLLSSMHQFLCP
jgi:hypothetical protein